MMKNIRILFALLLLGGVSTSGAFAQADGTAAGTVVATPASPAVPEEIKAKSDIAFEEEVHDFGTIEHGGNGTFEFKFTNTGSEPLVITNAKGSCGCTVPQWPRGEIAPGATDIIKVTYDTKRQGGFHKTVTLTTNSETSPVKTITIKGTVTPPPPPVQVTPTEGPVNTPGTPGM